MPTQQEENKKLDVRAASDEDKELVTTMNLGGESGNPGSPVIVSHGLHPRAQADPVWHADLLKENPPGAQIPAQDPTPLAEDDPRNLAAARGDQVPATGGPGAVRRLDDRTPDAVQAEAARPYNADASAAQRPNRSGQDTTEENEEGKPIPAATERVRKERASG